MSGSHGGGLVNSTGGTLNIRNTIVAGNIDHSSAAGAVVRADCVGAFNSQGYNLIGDKAGGSCAGFANGVNGDQIGDHTSGGAIDPRIGPPRDNGGATMTEALLPGSPALDAGDPRGCTDSLGVPLTTDQRGAARPWGRACDIGAYEYASTQRVLLPLVRK